MSGKIIKDVKPHHPCSGHPKIWRRFRLIHDVGTQWQCNVCMAIWEIKSRYDGVTAGRGWVLVKEGY